MPYSPCPGSGIPISSTLSLLFCPEEECRRLFQNVGNDLPDFMASHPENCDLCRWKLFFYIGGLTHFLGDNHTDIVCYQCLLILSHLKLMRSLLATILKRIQTPISVTVHRFELKKECHNRKRDKKFSF